MHKRIKRFFLIISLLLVFSAVLGAQERSRHQVRLGWGDPLFETLAFHPSLKGEYASSASIPAGFTREETFSYGYTGHIFGEYLYRCSKVVSVGVQLDVEGIFWQKANFDAAHQMVGEAVPVRNFDIDIIPTVRFTYLDTRWVRLYSGVGLGVLLAFDNAGEFGAAPTLNLNFLGVQVGKGHWGGAFELGMLNALRDSYHIYQLGTRLMSVSVYYKW